jgi:hypothetical protein
VENRLKKRTGKSVIAGIIIPAKWDDTGKVTGVTIQTNDETVYLVERTKTGEELLGLIRQKVEATGKIRERLDGSTLINVHEYKTMDEQFGNYIK